MAKKNNVPKNYFSFHLTTLRCIGINIFDIENPYLRILYNIYTVFLIITSYVGFTIVELWAMVKNIQDIETATFILCYWISHFMGCLKGMIFMMNKKSIRTFLKSFEEGVFIPDTTRGGESEINIIKRAISVANIQANAFYLMAGAAITNRVVYACRDSATIETIYDPVSNTTVTSIERTLPWYSWFWFDTRPTPNYQIAFFYQVWCVSLFGVEIGVLDTLISAMLVHLNAQFSILNNAILTVTERARRIQIEEFETDDSTNNGIINNNIAVISHSSDKILEDGWEEIPKNDPVLSKYLDASVSNCLAHHLKIIELSNNVEDQFNLMLLVQVLGSSFMFCFQLFQLSQMHLFSTKFMNMTAYFVLMLFQLSIYCYNGNEISMQSEQISVAAYNTDWFGAEDSVKKKLILMMVRAQRPIKISAGKFVFLSLATLMNIVRGSVSYYMFLHRMND